MLGETIGHEQGKVTTRRMLPGDDYRYVKMEINMETEVTLLGLQGTGIGTYTAYERVPGQLFGEGQGIMMLADGNELIWNGHGVGRVDEAGTVSFAASVAVQTGSEKLLRLNGVLVLIEHTVDMAGNVKSTFSEWKV